MISINTKVQPCKVFLWQTVTYPATETTKETRKLERVYQYDAVILGFGQEGDSNETCIVGLVRKDDGEICTISANCITLLPPSAGDGETAGAR
jgi:hypothetical protein